MKLQVAIDLLTTDAALELAGKVARYVDIIELGTSLIKSEGLAVITAVKKAHPDKIVFADMKTMDAGWLEAELAFKAAVVGVAIHAAPDPTQVAKSLRSAIMWRPAA